jgi:hypothetical protein
MKVVFIPGVGYQNSNSKYGKFLDGLKEEVNFEWEIFNWSHSNLEEEHAELHQSDHPEMEYNILRGWLSESILDFQYVLLHSNEIKVPDADIYIGHSAGSIVALTHAKEKCVLFGSPLNLIELDRVSNNTTLIYSRRAKITKVLNFIHKKDVLSHPLKHENVTNIFINNNFLNIFGYSPIKAHNSYWKSKKVKKEMIEALKEWKC